ncbi:MAG: recombinase family protein [Oscillospiraceae bacterium]|jgi:site-specific DNA recombinase
MELEIRDPERYSAGLYIRLSREDEGEGQSQSVSNQLVMLTDFARMRGLTVYDTYIDDGWSGTNFERPAFRRLLADIDSGHVNLVITKDLSRLGRDYIGTGHYLERWFPEHRVRYISLLDGVDTGIESAANDITPFRAIMNDMYAKDISKKIASVKHDKQRKGLFIGGKAPYGYRLSEAEKGRLLPDEPAAAVVRRCFALALEGRSCREIADILNADGIATPAVYAGLPRQGCGLWRSETVSALLRNEVYTGSMVQGRSRRVSYKSKKCVRQAREAWVVVPEMHEALVSSECFAQVAQLLDARSGTRERTHPFLLQGLLFCAECGAPLGVVARKNAVGGETLYLLCRSFQREGKAACSAHTFREEAVTAAVRTELRALCAACLPPAIVLGEAQRVLSEARRTDPVQHSGERIRVLTRQMDRCYLDRLEGRLSESDFERIYKRLCAERETLEHAACAEQAPLPAPEALAASFSPETAEKALLAALLARAELQADGVLTLYFRCRAPESEMSPALA